MSNNSRSNSFTGSPTPSSPRSSFSRTPSNLTQSDILRSRIDEQSNLICILKSRNDQLLAKINASDAQNESLIGQQATLKQQIFEENRRFERLEDHFNTLAKNHQEMIVIKDEYKTSNEKFLSDNKTLTLENLQLKDQLKMKDSKKIIELTMEIRDLQTNLKIESDLLRQQRSLNMEANDKLLRKEENLAEKMNEIKKLSKSIEEYRKKLSNMTILFRKDSEKYELQIKNLEEEQDKLVASNLKRGELLNKRESENSEMKSEVKKLIEKVKLLEQRWIEESDKIDANYKVKCLMKELEDCRLEIDQLEMHKSKLKSELNNQKKLNERLVTYK